MAFYLLGGASIGEGGSDAINIIGPSWLALTLGLGVLRMLRMNSSTIWTALFWFRASAAVYFGFGSLVPFLASADTRLYLQAFYLFDGEDVTKINLVCAAGCFVALLSSNACQVLINSNNARRPASRLRLRPTTGCRTYVE